MRNFLCLASAVAILGGCASPADREVDVCNDFFSIAPLDGADTQAHIDEVLQLAEAHTGTSIGRKAGAYGRGLQIFWDDVERFGTTFQTDDEALAVNIGLYRSAMDLKEELTARCDDLLTGR